MPIRCLVMIGGRRAGWIPQPPNMISQPMRGREMSNDTSMSQTDVVVYGIKKMILDGELTPGAQLPIEKDLAPRLGVARSSLREGVRALSIMGVLETRQGAGTYVTTLDSSLLMAPMGFVVDLQHDSRAENLHAVRRVLETQAAGQAAELIDDEMLAEATAILDAFEQAITADVIDHEAGLDSDIAFHRIIAKASGNPVLAALIDALASRTLRGRLWRAIADDHAEQATLAEHRSILKAIADHSSERARLRMANHLLAVEEFLHENAPSSEEFSTE
jgi:GntR family transcriptional repressor for pyruvate dehydrogenase complex